MNDVQFSEKMSKASPKLLLACATGEHIKKAVLYVRKQGKDQQDYYVVTMNDFIVSSYQSGGSNGSHHLPTDQFALNFSKIKFEYKPQKDDGSLEAPVTAGWDLKTNAKL
jgi:type VI secretion system secreted protein Hcp